MLKLLPMLFVMPALAQGTEQYWQQLYAQSQAQCGQSMVTLAKQLDDAKRQIEDLQKQLEAAKK
jgi:hypothetical protein